MRNFTRKALRSRFLRTFTRILIHSSKSTLLVIIINFLRMRLKRNLCPLFELNRLNCCNLLKLCAVDGNFPKIIFCAILVLYFARRKSPRVVEDNCCLCNVAGVRSLSGVAAHDILYASFRNRLFEVPFVVVADHSTKSVVVVMRGSISLRDIFTDFTAASYELEAPELPPNCKVRLQSEHLNRII